MRRSRAALAALTLFAILTICRAAGAAGTVEVGASASGTLEADIRDIRPPVAQRTESEFPWKPFAAACAIAAAILAASRLARRGGAKTDGDGTDEPEKPRIAPDVAALTALDELGSSGLVEKGAYKEWCTRISMICRVYCGDSLGFNCVDLAGDEIIPALDGLGIPRKLSLEVDSIAADCDLVKFARHVPSETEARDIHSRCRALVMRTRRGWRA